MNLLEKYRPRHLSELLGQEWASQQLTLFAANPHPCAFLFAGETGTGKTTAALLLAEALGVDVASAEFGGLHQIASGEQTGETVRRTMEGLRCRPWSGSGWRVLVVNEADAMTPGAAVIWLDALENLPPTTCVIFTTNKAAKIPARLRDRCELLVFQCSALLLRPAMQEMIERVWRAEGCTPPAPEVESLAVADEHGNASFRRLLQKLTPFVRAGVSPPPLPAPVQKSPPPDRTVTVPVAGAEELMGPPCAIRSVTTPLDEWGYRWSQGEKIVVLAREAGISWNALHVKLTKLGYKKGA